MSMLCYPGQKLKCTTVSTKANERSKSNRYSYNIKQRPLPLTRYPSGIVWKNKWENRIKQLECIGYTEHTASQPEGVIIAFKSKNGRFKVYSDDTYSYHAKPVQDKKYNLKKYIKVDTWEELMKLLKNA